MSEKEKEVLGPEINGFKKFDGKKPDYSYFDKDWFYHVADHTGPLRHDAESSFLNRSMILDSFMEAMEAQDAKGVSVALVARWPEALDSAARILCEAAGRYGRDNWRLCTDTTRYTAALRRHYSRLPGDGEWYLGIDPDSGEMELGHILCNLMFLSVLGGSL